MSDHDVDCANCGGPGPCYYYEYSPSRGVWMCGECCAHADAEAELDELEACEAEAAAMAEAEESNARYEQEMEDRYLAEQYGPPPEDE